MDYEVALDVIDPTQPAPSWIVEATTEREARNAVCKFVSDELNQSVQDIGTFVLQCDEEIEGSSTPRLDPDTLESTHGDKWVPHGHADT